MNERRELLCTLQQYDFALYDLQLYLDSHPECKEAMQKYKKYKAMRQNILEQYTRLYGPVRADQSDTNEKWNWVQNPWPWEKEGN
ncbi:MAG: spore coat protein CotJB [Ruminococcus sp.]|nr:spore coat protein CotJB [Ruminococcus sp.]